ncbi:hypothetical protein I7I48_05894 [Histoplasma ohiense]|nr:hypothetical protein I7I48_05894 [Histoplasma ohiense (nom. inval.)]
MTSICDPPAFIQLHTEPVESDLCELDNKLHAVEAASPSACAAASGRLALQSSCSNRTANGQ